MAAAVGELCGGAKNFHHEVLARELGIVSEMRDTMLEQHTIKRARVSLSKKKHTQKAHRIQKRAKKKQARSQAERKDVNSAMSYLGQGRGRDFAAAAASHASAGSQP